MQNLDDFSVKMSVLDKCVIPENGRKNLRSIDYQSSSFFEDRSLMVEEDLCTKCLSATFFAIKKFVASIKFTLFKEIFMAIYRKNPDHLESLHEQFQEQLFLQLKQVASQIYTEEDNFFSPSPCNKFVWEKKCAKINRRSRQKRPKANFYREESRKLISKLQSDNEEREDEILRNHEDILNLEIRIRNLNTKITEELDKLYEIALQVAV